VDINLVGLFKDRETNDAVVHDLMLPKREWFAARVFIMSHFAVTVYSVADFCGC
jgi:hypothetical protein